MKLAAKYSRDVHKTYRHDNWGGRIPARMSHPEPFPFASRSESELILAVGKGCCFVTAAEQLQLSPSLAAGASCSSDALSLVSVGCAKVVSADVLRNIVQRRPPVAGKTLLMVALDVATATWMDVETPGALAGTGARVGAMVDGYI